jgi:hypothetical protein
MGLSILHGVMPVDQFCPHGSSDADTSNVKPTRFAYDAEDDACTDAVVPMSPSRWDATGTALSTFVDALAPRRG